MYVYCVLAINMFHRIISSLRNGNGYIGQAIVLFFLSLVMIFAIRATVTSFGDFEIKLLKYFYDSAVGCVVGHMTAPLFTPTALNVLITDGVNHDNTNTSSF